MRALLTILFCAWLSQSASAYTLDGGTQTATTDGSDSDVQAAHDDASVVSGWIVTSPDGGTDTWGTGVTFTKQIHFRSANGYATINGSATSFIQGAKGGTHRLKISGFKFSGAAGSSGGNKGKITITGSWSDNPFVISDCYFTESSTRSIRVECNGGLIANCHFTGGGGANDSGIQHKNDTDPDGSWTTAGTYGTADSDGDLNLYIEDCRFTNMIYQAIDFDGSSRAALRYCIFIDSAVTSHGADTGPKGARQVEIYGCVFKFLDFGDCDGSLTLPLDYFIFIRGGTWLITGNTFDRLQSCAWGSKLEIKLQDQNIRRTPPVEVGCQTSYPAFHQCGWGHNGTSQVIDPIYEWDNTMTESTLNMDVSQYADDTCGNGMDNDDFTQVNREWYRATSRPGFTPYTYPHPLQGGDDVTAPTVSTVTISSDGTTWTFACSESVTIGAGGNGGFTTSMSGGAVTLTYSSGSGSSSLVYTGNRTVQLGESGTLAYTQPGNGVEDAAGNDLATFSGKTVVNNSSQTGAIPPVVGQRVLPVTLKR